MGRIFSKRDDMRVLLLLLPLLCVLYFVIVALALYVIFFLFARRCHPHFDGFGTWPKIPSLFFLYRWVFIGIWIP